MFVPKYKTLIDNEKPETVILVEINEGVRQGCPLSPIRFGVYVDSTVTQWQNRLWYNLRIIQTALDAFVCRRPGSNCQI